MRLIEVNLLQHRDCPMDSRYTINADKIIHISVWTSSEGTYTQIGFGNNHRLIVTETYDELIKMLRKLK